MIRAAVQRCLSPVNHMLRTGKVTRAMTKATTQNVPRRRLGGLVGAEGGTCISSLFIFRIGLEAQVGSASSRYGVEKGLQHLFEFCSDLKKPSAIENLSSLTIRDIENIEHLVPVRRNSGELHVQA